MSASELNADQQRQLLQLAREAIARGLETRRAWVPDLNDLPEALREPGASFVTLTRFGELRGCIGTLEVYQALAKDVAEHAYAAAFSDPRFPPLSSDEFTDLELEISILGPAEALDFRDEADLLRQLRPGVDGLILQIGEHRGTFLPSVWHSLKTPGEFLAHLKQKAGLPADYWSDALKVWRYTTCSFGEAATAA